MLRKITSRPAFKAAMAKAAQNVSSAPAKAAAEEAPRGGGLRKIVSKVAAAVKAAQASKAPEQAPPTNLKGVGGRLKKVMRGMKFKEGGMADKSGRAMKRKTADTKGRAMKKGK
jgi:hypothetical protein